MCQVFSKARILFSIKGEEEQADKNEDEREKEKDINAKRRETLERRTTDREGGAERGGRGGEGGGFNAHPPVHFEYSVDRIFENARNVTIRLPNVTARNVRLQLFFALRWMLISEVTFESGEKKK